MTWTTVADLRAQVQKLWDKGDLLRPAVHSKTTPPRRLRLVGPSSAELGERFDAVRAWMQALGCGTEPLRYRIVLREFRHRVLGGCAVPDEIWLDTWDDALALVGKQKEAKRFTALVQHTRALQPALLPWLEKRPLNALVLADVWPRLLQVVTWLQAHPRPGMYLRQVDVPGVDSKFIEAHRSVLGELLDLALAPEVIDFSASGASQFCQRYGFKDKLLRVRFRLLDAALLGSTAGWLPADAEHDMSLTQSDFARLTLPVRQVFFTENEVNFLAFPPVPGSLVVFGAGYGFEALAPAQWLHACSLYYWGDIDTHGFAILDQLRAHFPQVQSLLMDRATLLAHTDLWGEEAQPVQRDLPRLHPDEAALFDDLRKYRLRADRADAGIRLEQERLGFEWVKAALVSIKRDIT